VLPEGGGGGGRGLEGPLFDDGFPGGGPGGGGGLAMVAVAMPEQTLS